MQQTASAAHRSDHARHGTRSPTLQRRLQQLPAPPGQRRRDGSVAAAVCAHDGSGLRVCLDVVHDPVQGVVRLLDPASGDALVTLPAATAAEWEHAAAPAGAEAWQARVGELFATAQAGGHASAPLVLPEVAPGQRRKLWDLRASYHCPVIGTCLSVEELRRSARQLGQAEADRMSDYELHAWFVNLAGSRNAAAKRLHKQLDRKWTLAVKRFAAARDDAGVLTLWREARARGDIAGPFWAVLTHAHVTSAVCQQVYQEVHMLSHQVGAGHRADLARLAELERENHGLSRQMQRTSTHAAQQLAAKERLLEEARRQLTHARENEARLAALERGAMVTALRRQLAELERRLADGEQEKAHLRRQLAALLPQPAHTPAAPVADTSAIDACADCPQGGEDGRCGDPDLCGRCILCVGGRSGSADRYRALVERSNGRFLHHDGGLEDNPHRLKGLLARADAVVCPADCVSHTAYWQVKQFCKENGKPCVLLRSSGVSSWARALDALMRPGAAERGITLMARPPYA